MIHGSLWKETISKVSKGERAFPCIDSLPTILLWIYFEFGFYSIIYFWIHWYVDMLNIHSINFEERLWDCEVARVCRDFCKHIIELLASPKYDSRKIARFFEVCLHVVELLPRVELSPRSVARFILIFLFLLCQEWNRVQGTWRGCESLLLLTKGACMHVSLFHILDVWYLGFEMIRRSDEKSRDHPVGQLILKWSEGHTGKNVFYLGCEMITTSGVP